MTTVLVVDNYDSFVYNLVHYLTELGADCLVRRNDEVGTDALADVDGVLVSPGPGTPEQAGVSVAMVRACAAGGRPLLGVCLGHQAIAVAYGGVVRRSAEPWHGRSSAVHHRGDGVLAGMPCPFAAARYHSLVVEPGALPAELAVTAWTGSGVVMGLRHRTLPLEGVQFHPESVLSEAGHRLLANWLRVCGLAGAVDRAPELDAPYDDLRVALPPPAPRPAPPAGTPGHPGHPHVVTYRGAGPTKGHHNAKR